VTTGSDAAEIPGPVYLDASAWVKLYVQEPQSDALNGALLGRKDLFVCDLGATEVASALGRACREGRLDRVAARRLQRTLHQHVASGVVQRLELTSKVHREAERLLLSATVPLRAADALHVALASLSEAATVVTYDPRLADAARSAGIPVAMPGSDGESAGTSPRRGKPGAGR
jgi:predicted nucleic acid-binding protein